MAKYKAKAKTTKITATSRCAVKIKDNFYTVEFAEERSLNPDEKYDLDMERSLLFQDINEVIDNQIADIISMAK